MKLIIDINETQGNANITIEAEDKVTDWKDLSDERQAMAINALYNFTNLFQRAYIDSHLPDFPETEKPQQDVE